MFRIEMLPAQDGDCLWIEYGEADPSTHRRVLIDAGRPGTARVLRRKIRSLPEGRRRFELLVLTHVDSDHVGGAAELLADKAPGLSFGDIWFNGYKHVSDELGPVEAERLTSLLEKGRLPWNERFSGKAVTLDGGPPRTEVLDGGLRLTILGPTRKRLAELAPEWEKTVVAAGLVPGRGAPPKRTKDEPEDTLGDESVEGLARERFDGDKTSANGSSIALLAEYGGRRILLGGDTYAPDLLAALERIEPEAQVRVDAFKLPHHGSKANLNVPLLQKLSCPRYLVSTSGARFRHPDAVTIARVLMHGGRRPKLFFNYQSKFNRRWESDDSTYPPEGEAGLAVDLEA